MSSAIQSAHFGANQHQITLHTGVYYIGGQCTPHTFCTVFYSLQHRPTAIWKYVEPVLDELQRAYPGVNTLHMFSDGPTSQYRQKLNFYLFTKVISDRHFTLSSWNFFEAGHGKGVPDGVGAAVKRAADEIVLTGTDITSAGGLFEHLRIKSSVKLYHVKVNDVKTICANTARDISVSAVTGTMKMHQL